MSDQFTADNLNEGMLPVPDVTPSEAKLAETFMVIGSIEAKDTDGKRLAWYLPARIAVLLARHVLTEGKE